MEGFSEDLVKKLDNLELQFDELDSLISRVEIASDSKLYSFYYKQFVKISPIVNFYKKYKKVLEDIEETKSLSNDNSNNDASYKSLLDDFENEKIKLQDTINDLLFKMQDFELERVRVEISCKDTNHEFFELVIQMIKNFCVNEEYNYSILEKGKSSQIFQIFGDGAYEKLKFANGIFKQIKNGKESKLTVVTLKELRINTEIKDDDLFIETLKSSGAGGQHINKTESAVRITHLPTKISVKCEDERSQVQNKEKAMTMLRNKLVQINQKKNEKYIKNQRDIIKNIIFSNSAICIFDFDRNRFMFAPSKQELDLAEVLDGNFSKIKN